MKRSSSFALQAPTARPNLLRFIRAAALQAVRRDEGLYEGWYSVNRRQMEEWNLRAHSVHPFPARMAPEIALSALTSLGRKVDDKVPAWVLDPMCGSGTVLMAAKSHGFRAIGRDVDPLAVLISRVAVLGKDSIDAREIEMISQDIISNADTADPKNLPWTDPETVEFAKYWFGESQLTQLSGLSNQIACLEEGKVKDILNLSLSRLIDTKKPKASLASDTSHSRPHKTLESSDYDVFDGFIKAVDQVLKRVEKHEWRGESEIKEGDARQLDIDDASIDAVITSPPYLNAIDYMRGHKLSLIWMGYTIPQLRLIRSESVGSSRRPTGPVDLDVREMVRGVREKASNLETLPTGVIERYANDMCAISSEIHRVLRCGALAVLVVGNSTVRGNYIENDKLAQIACERAGLVLTNRIEREIPESSRYLPLHGKSLEKRMRAEVVLTFEKG